MSEELFPISRIPFRLKVFWLTVEKRRRDVLVTRWG
jgi:hypothetical protein